jgi:putative oxidoreductase
MYLFPIKRTKINYFNREINTWRTLNFKQFKMDAHIIFQALVLLFFIAVLGESGINKLLDYKGNKAYFEEQFKNSSIASSIDLLFPLETAMEIGTTVLSVVGLFQILFSNNGEQWGLWAVSLACLTFISLIFGQRMAKDYVGAAGVVPYMAVSLIGLLGFLH